MRQRLVNCDFLNSNSFNVISNKAKLLYVFMLLNADDRGFVDNTSKLIETFEKNDKEYDEQVSLTLLGNDYECALNDLIERGFIYEFRDNHNNKIHLIRHWFFHNQWRRGLWTNYNALSRKVELVENEYILKEINKIKVNENKLNENQDSVETTMTQQEIIAELNKPKKELSKEELLKELEDDTLPFEKGDY